MKKCFSKFIAVLLAVMMIAACIPVGASAYTKTGSLGGNVKWSYDTQTKVITVSGSGNMKNFSKANDGQGFDKIFWAQYPNKDAKKIVIQEGVTNIGNNAFRSLTGVTSVTIPSTVTGIGQSAFEGCSALTSVNLTEKVTSIGAYAFKGTKFASVNMPYSVTSIGDYAFDSISGLKIACNYGDAAYNYCVKHNAAYTFKPAELVLDAVLNTEKKQVDVTIKIRNASGLNAANITLVYDKILTPISKSNTADNMSDDSDVVTAVVFNEAGKVSIAVLAKDCVKLGSCSGKCEYTVAQLAFKADGDGDKVNISASVDPLMRNNERLTIAPASATVDLHIYTSTVTKEATCCEEGERVFVCQLCDKKTTEKIEKNPNNHTGGTEIRGIVEATCTAEGYTGDTVCKGCGAVLTKGEAVAKKAHDYQSTVTAPTCTAEGFTTYTCAVCGDSYVSDKVAAAHDYKAIVTAPTCTASGYTTYTCAVCGDSYKGDAVAALGHSYDANGTCTVCGHVTVTALTFKDNSGITVDNASKTVIIKKTLNAGDLRGNIATNGWEVLDNKGAKLDDGKAVMTCATVKNTATGTTYTIIILGDVNADGKVTAADARVTLRVSAKLDTISDVVMLAADIDGNGKITAADARKVLRASAKLESF